ncbi:MAG: hypothetical protein QXK24_06660 [Ignisphaera sp.]
MKITPIIIKQFREFLKRSMKPGADLEIIGINLKDDETIKSFLKEFCLDLTYSECKKRIMDLYPQLFKYTPSEYEEEALRQMDYYLGTPYVSEAFKVLYKRYSSIFEKAKYLPAIDELMEETELPLITDVLTSRYGCIDYDVRRFEDLRAIGIYVHDLRDMDVEKAFEQFIALGYRESSDRRDYLSFLGFLGVAGYLSDYYLICIVEYGKEGEDKGTVITSVKKPFILLNIDTKKIAIVY